MTENIEKLETAKFIKFNIGLWNLYFILKIYFYFNDNLNFHVIENIAFFLWLIFPITSKSLVFIRTLSAPFIAAILLYYDSWLPPIKHMFSQTKNLSGFDEQYILELVTRVFTVELLSLFIATFLFYQIIKHYVRLSVISAILIGAVIYVQSATMPAAKDEFVNQQANTQSKSFTSIDEQLTDFYQTEATRLVDYSTTELKAPFDLLIINVCSLSWDDLQITGLDNHPIFQRFDVLFSQFNSATSYSGPAAIRLLRASCGQTKHEVLYQDTNKQCYLADNLKALGFDTQLAMNHDGQFDDFENYVRKNGRWSGSKLMLDRVPVAQHAFDGSPIYSDRAIFDLLLSKEEASPQVTYYNTVSLHDGNKIVNDRSYLNSLENYHPRVATMLNDLTYLFDSIERSGKKIMVVLVPEHGAGIEGDKLQIPGMREFPAVDITKIPVGVKFFGLDRTRTTTIQVNQPSSYLALSSMIQKVIASNLYGKGEAVDLMPITQDLPSTQAFSENQSSIVGKYQNDYYLKIDQEDWMLYQQ